ncbi:MAG: type II toxin-antitoxin system VapC family toxin [Thermoprotei archaeon]
MRVIDASVIVAFLLKEPGWKDLGEIVKRGVSVDLVLKEVANAIWKEYSLRKRIDRETAVELYKVLTSLTTYNIELEPEHKYLEKAFEIALDNSITIYDALYIVLAKEKNLELATLNDKQARIARKLGIGIVP